MFGVFGNLGDLASSRQPTLGRVSCIPQPVCVSVGVLARVRVIASCTVHRPYRVATIVHDAPLVQRCHFYGESVVNRVSEGKRAAPLRRHIGTCSPPLPIPGFQCPMLVHRRPRRSTARCEATPSAAVPCCIIVANRKSHWEFPYDSNTLEQCNPMEVLDEVASFTLATRWRGMHSCKMLCDNDIMYDSIRGAIAPLPQYR